MKELNQWAPKMLDALRAIPGLLQVNSDQQDRGLQASLVIDRATASRLGITTQMIDDTLYDAFGQRQVSTMYTPLNQYHVVMEVDPQYWQNPDGLRTIYVRAANGGQIPLSAFTHYEPSNTALGVTHQGQFPSVTLSFNLGPGMSLGDAVAAVETARAGDRTAGEHTREFSGDGASVSSITGQRADAHRRRAGNGLHRPRCAL